jgi:hypothetical protein
MSNVFIFLSLKKIDSFQDVRVLDQKYILAKNSEETSQEEFSLISAKTLQQVEACSPEQIMFTDIPSKTTFH